MLRVVVAVMGLAPAIARADPPAQPENHPLCALGERGQACSTILITELDLQGGGGPFFQANAEAGLLINAGQLHAFGLAGGITSWQRGDSDATRVKKTGFVIEARYRFWLGDRVGLDFGAGGGDTGAVADVALEYHDIVGVVGGYLYDGSTASAASIGIRVSLLAVLAAAAH